MWGLQIWNDKEPKAIVGKMGHTWDGSWVWVAELEEYWGPVDTPVIVVVLEFCA